MAKLATDIGTSRTLHPRENLYVQGTIGALNGEVIIASDGCSTLSIDLRGTFNLTLEVSGTIDGTNWILIPVRNLVGGAYVAALAGTVSLAAIASCAGYRQVRARCTAYTSGAVNVTLMASTAPFDNSFKDGNITPLILTATGAAGAAVTATIPNPGVGLRNYITYFSINRFAAALLVAAATPVLVTTTNLPGTLVFSFPADAAAQGTIDRLREDIAYPIASSAQNATTVVTCPATTNVIWRVTLGYYVAP